jgi:hypothetical protein
MMSIVSYSSFITLVVLLVLLSTGCTPYYFLF